MEPISMVIIGTTLFGVLASISVFIRQLLLSRDKRLNDKAQRRALAQESKTLEKIRQQMESSQRFRAHYQVLGDNKEAIQYLDEKIEEILQKKLHLIQRYSRVALKESSAIIAGEQLAERKDICDLLRKEMDEELLLYDRELEQLQARRSGLWASYKELETYLLEQEQSRNQSLDSLYHRHSSILGKIYHRHNDHTEEVAKESIRAGTESFKFLLEPLRYLFQCFGMGVSSTNDGEASKAEKESRQRVSRIEQAINGEENESVDSEDEFLDALDFNEPTLTDLS